MNSVPRKLTLGLVLTFFAVACGDDVQITEEPPPTPVVRSVVVSPSSATVAAGQSFTFGAAVDADAPLARTVTWTSSNAAVAAVDANGVATAVATLTAGGVSSICAAATADAAVKGCAQLTVTPAAAAATVQIDAMTVGCTPLNAALPGGGGGCGLQVPIQTNNAGGQIDVAVIVSRPAGSGVTGVTLEVMGGATFATVEDTYTQTLTGDFITESDLALQTGNPLSSRIVFSIQSATYSLSATNVATVKHTNGQKKFRVRLVGGAGTAQAETQITFRNANGFHINAVDPTGTNINGLPIRQTSAAGFAWRGGTPLTISASPVNYTGVALPTAAGSFSVNIGGCPSGNVVGPAVRVASATLTSGVWTGTLPYTNNPLNASVNTLDGYEMSPACQVTGEVPGANGVDATGNAYITVPLGGVFGAFNTLNNPVGPVVPTLPVTTNFRLDDNGPLPIPGYAPNPNGRLNGWWNGSVAFDKLNMAAVLASPNPTQIAAADVNGIVLPTGVGNNLPVDFGFGGATSFRARGGGTVGGLPCNAPVGQVPVVTVANCATFAQRTSVTSAPALGETANYFNYGLIVQSVDAFGNGTNPPAAGVNFNIANPFDPVNPLAANGVLIGGVDVTNPTLVALGGNGSTATTAGVIQLSDAAAATAAANDCSVNAPPAPFMATALPGGLLPGKCWVITAQDQATALPAIASGIATIPGVQGELWVSQQRRDANSNLNWCPTAVFPAATATGVFQVSSTACASWLTGTTTFNMAAGAINPSWVGPIADAYYGISLFTRDQAGNQSTAFARQFVHDATQPTAAPPSFTPAVLPATGNIQVSAGATDNLDVGRGAFAFQYPLLAGTGANAPQQIRSPWVNKATGAANPAGFLFDGPSTVSANLSASVASIRSIEAVTAGGAFPTFTIGAATGNIQTPGIITVGTTQAAAALSNVSFFSQSVTRWNNVQNVAPNTAVGALANSGVVLAQTGMPGGAAYFANQDATVPPFTGMGWAVINPGGNPIDVSGNAGNGEVNSKTISAVAVGHAAGQVLPNPFPGGVKFYAVDVRQNPLGFPVGAAAGTALVEICTAGTPLNDQVANSWTFSCVYNPGSGGTNMHINHDFGGFNQPNSANLFGSASNEGFLGGPSVYVTPGALSANVPVLAIGFSATGNGLATLQNTTTGFNLNP